MFAFSMRKFFWGLFVAVIGLVIWAHNYGLINVSFSFSRDWPIVIVAAGLMSMWGALFGRHWYAGCSRATRDSIPNKAKKILEDLEKGEISAEEAAKKLGE